MLNGEQRTVLRQAMSRRLEDLRGLILEELAVEEQQKERMPGDRMGDFRDEAVGADLLRTEDALVGLHRSEAQRLEAALARIDDADFGHCADCGGAIGFERLRAYPGGTRCQPCQGRFESAASTAARRSR